MPVLPGRPPVQHDQQGFHPALESVPSHRGLFGEQWTQPKGGECPGSLLGLCAVVSWYDLPPSAPASEGRCLSRCSGCAPHSCFVLDSASDPFGGSWGRDLGFRGLRTGETGPSSSPAPQWAVVGRSRHSVHRFSRNSEHSFRGVSTPSCRSPRAPGSSGPWFYQLRWSCDFKRGRSNGQSVRSAVGVFACYASASRGEGEGPQ